ncbi:hypothetical protein O1L60_05175 [Streptomyces diastatochromogenes]|nr:hypothetical protein [Streptomyces diastatochromogenes]
MKERAGGERGKTMRQLVLCDDEGAGAGGFDRAEVIPLHEGVAEPRPAWGTRWAGRLLVASGLALLPWLYVLATGLPATATAAHWPLAWVGLDALEALGLIATGLLAARGDRRHSWQPPRPRRCSWWTPGSTPPPRPRRRLRHRGRHGPRRRTAARRTVRPTGAAGAEPARVTAAVARPRAADHIGPPGNSVRRIAGAPVGRTRSGPVPIPARACAVPGPVSCGSRSGPASIPARSRADPGPARWAVAVGVGAALAALVAGLLATGVSGRPLLGRAARGQDSSG